MTSLPLNSIQPQRRWDQRLMNAQSLTAPRYTSYPTATQFKAPFAESLFLNALSSELARDRNLSLYLHLPFCSALCYYCGCNRVVTRSADRKRQYLNALLQEMKAVAAHVDSHRLVTEIHFGGGTPTDFTDAELTELWFTMSRHFHLQTPDAGDYSIELDPRRMSSERLGFLRGLGFNRISFGVQDLDAQVQRAINRVQPREMIRDLTRSARAYGFRSINYDLIYGLPHQDERTMAQLLDDVISWRPDRIALFNYAHLPSQFPAQRLLQVETLPPPEVKLDMFCLAQERLLQAGYQQIGMDHFALPSDELGRAFQEQRLQRNFQGYAVDRQTDLIGFGASAISQTQEVYCQNIRNVADYQAAIVAGQSSKASGCQLSPEDRLRQAIIMALMTAYRLDICQIEQQFNIEFEAHFAPELTALQRLEREGLLQRSPCTIRLTEAGQLVVRRVCAVFDQYLPGEGGKSGAAGSRVI